MDLVCADSALPDCAILPTRAPMTDKSLGVLVFGGSCVYLFVYCYQDLLFAMYLLNKPGLKWFLEE